MIELGWLAFLAEPWFVGTWYAVGLVAALSAVRSRMSRDAPVDPAGPVLLLFLSVVGLVTWPLVRTSPRARAAVAGVGGSVLGIVSATIVARAAGFSFWEEFWFAYGLGFAAAWLPSLMRSTHGHPEHRWQAGLVELASTTALVTGTGLVSGFVTPRVVGMQPDADTWAFWGFAALGLVMGALVAIPLHLLVDDAGWHRARA